MGKDKEFHPTLGMDKKFQPILYWTCEYLSMLGLTLIHVSKRGPCKARPFRYDTVIFFQGAYDSYYTDGRLTERSREVSKPRDSGFYFFNRSEIWQAPLLA